MSVFVYLKQTSSRTPFVEYEYIMSMNVFERQAIIDKYIAEMGPIPEDAQVAIEPTIIKIKISNANKDI